MLEDRRKQLCTQLYCRQLRLNDLRSQDYFNNSFEGQVHSKPFAALTYEYLQQLSLTLPLILPLAKPEQPPWYLPQNLSCILKLGQSKKESSPVRLKQLFLEHKQSNHPNCFVIFTDGSKSRHGTSIGIVRPRQRSPPPNRKDREAKLHYISRHVQKPKHQIFEVLPKLPLCTYRFLLAYMNRSRLEEHDAV